MRRFAVFAFASLAVAFAWPQQGPGWEENSHYALVRALASGTPVVDRALGEIGELSTGDVVRRGRHLYANRAPGLAFASLPPFLALDAAGVRTKGDPTTIEWALGLISVVLPALIVLLVAAWRVERVEPGFGVLIAVALGLGTLLLPFASMFFSHALAAALGFGAFALLLVARDRPWVAPAAGVCAGLAVTTEYPSVIAVAVLGVYALAVLSIRRTVAYVVGVAAGVAPLLAYNAWAFGSPFHVSYEHSLAGGKQFDTAFFGLGAPKLDALRDVLVSAQGLFVVSPVVAAALVGILLLYRSGRRAEALVPASIVLAYVTWNAAYIAPLGGLQPGPRYLIFVIPFLAMPLAAALRVYPTTVLALAAAGAFGLVIMTATGAHAAYDGQWLQRAANHDFRSTAAAVAGFTGWYTIVPFFLACGAAAVLAVRATRRPAGNARDLLFAACAVAAWALLRVFARNDTGAEIGSGYATVAALCALGVAVAVTRPALPLFRSEESVEHAGGRLEG